MASRLLVCDLGSGFLHRLNWNGTGLTDTVLGRLKNPDHVAACDFDRDGFQDFVVADLGGIQPTNERTGSVFLLRGRDPAGQFDVETVQEGLGRVADVEVADLDGDGDHDFLVAEFGFETLGRLIWLETLAIEQGFPRTRLHVIDTRHGAIHAPPIDLDGDGDMDLIALFSQEHETIVAFFNDGQGTFAAKELFTAPTPSFGSSGLELVDLDQDGDQDVIFTNGDTLDKFQLKPFHAVHWLENRGNQQFDYHHLTNLPGAIRAVAGDLDGDGDLDIAAAAFCPSLLLHQTRPAVLDTLIWLEQTAPGEFARHVVDRSDPGHMSLATGDLNGDGRLDLVVGEFTPNDTSVRRWLKIFWNRRPLPRDENDQTPREEPIP